MKRNIIFVILILIGAALTFFILWSTSQRRSAVAEVDSFADCVAAGFPVMESYPRQCRTPDGRVFVEDTEEPKPTDVMVEEPRVNELIASPVTVAGQAPGPWFFEANLPLAVVDESGRELGVGYATAQGDWMTTELVPFSGTVSFATPSTTTGFVIVKKDNPSGLPQNDAEYRVPVRFDLSTTTQQMTLKVFFSNTKLLEPDQDDCATVFPAMRTVTSTPVVARAAIEELLKGPTEQEKAAGFATSINPGVKLQKLVIVEGTAYADFDEQLEFQVGGSCRVAAISAQIRETLKQFPSVNKVIISIDGRTEDILQP